MRSTRRQCRPHITGGVFWRLLSASVLLLLWAGSNFLCPTVHPPAGSLDEHRVQRPRAAGLAAVPLRPFGFHPGD